MRLAYVMSPGKGDTDLLLQQVAEILQTLGRRPCGLVQINTDNPRGGRCDMDVRVLPQGTTLRISQSLGRGARGCRLDADALETAVTLVDAALENGADCLIINKFGKQEANGRGFRNTIAEALVRELPVLVGLNGLNLEAFQTFAGDMAEQLPSDPTRVVEWFDARPSGRGFQVQSAA